MAVILVGTDGSDASLRAVEWATEEAARRRQDVRIVHAVAPWLYDTPVDPRFAAIRKWLLSTGQEVVDGAVAAVRERDAGVPARGEMMPGPAARALLEQAADAGMVVLGGHGAGTAAGLLLGSTTLQVVAHAPVPAVVVRELEPAVRSEVAVGVDGSAISEPAIGFAFEEAALRGARLRVVHAWTHPASGPGDMAPLVYDTELVADEESRVIGESLAGWREKFPDVEVVRDVVRGRAVRVLAGVSARADLLVVGSRGRGGFTGLLLGSVSHGLLHHAHCPLAIVPTEKE